MGRAPCCDKVGLKKGRWTSEEDEILIKYIQANGEGSWRSLPKNAGLLRCGKSCRLRWINYLRSDLKRGNISSEEDETIIKLHSSMGNRWSLIASHLPGRTDNEIKNYWNSHLSRKIHSFRRSSGETLPMVMDSSKADIPPKRKGGRTSRWAMKKNKTYYIQKDVPKIKPKDSPLTSNIEEVLLLPTPDLEQETFSSTTINDRMVLDPKVNDNERESLVLRSDEAWKCENQRLYASGEKKTETLVPYDHDQEGIDGGVFNDIVDNDLLDPDGVLALTEGRGGYDIIDFNDENDSGFMCADKMAATHEDLQESGQFSSNGDNGEWYSCSSITSGFDDGVERGNEIWDEKERMLSSLWESDNWEGDSYNLSEIDSDTHDAMVAWLLS